MEQLEESSRRQPTGLMINVKGSNVQVATKRRAATLPSWSICSDQTNLVAFNTTHDRC